MLSSSSITKLLANPQNISDADHSAIDELADKYPYFLAGRYLQTAKGYKKNGTVYTPGYAGNLYTANWLLYRDFLNRVNPAPVAVKETTETRAPAPVAQPVAEVKNTAPEITVPVIKEERVKEPELTTHTEPEIKEELIQPVFTEDYFRHEGIQVSEAIPEEIEVAAHAKETEAEEAAKTLMVMRSFAEWLAYFKSKKEKDKEEIEDKKALKSMWQKEKLAAALEEENEEIPEEVFKMAIDSIASEEGLMSESLAEVHHKQGKYDKAIDMYRKLSLRNPQKKIYFARKIEEILKEKQS